MINACTYDTPVGDLTVLTETRSANGSGEAETIVAAGFCPAAELYERLPPGARSELREVERLGPVHDLIERYLGGDVAAIDGAVLSQAGTELQQEVWQGLRDIPPGETRTYTELAGTTSKPNAVRAVGSACGRNLIAPFVPCHRALRSDGSLGGYYYGLEVKRWLLDHESSEGRLPLS